MTQEEIDLSILEEDEDFDDYVAENSKNVHDGEVDQEAWEDNWEDKLDKLPKADKSKVKGGKNKSKAKPEEKKTVKKASGTKTSTKTSKTNTKC